MLLIVAVAALALQETGKTAPPAGALSAAAVAPSASESAASARQWLALVDGQQWKQSWSAAGSVFTSHISAADWQSRVQPLRQQLGAVTSRVLKTVTKANALPGVPDGQYEILQFATDFAQKGPAVETVTLAHEPSGWKVDGYFIAPAPPASSGAAPAK